MQETPLETWTVEVTADTSQLRSELTNAGTYGREFTSSLVTAFDGLATKGKSVTDVMSQLALSVSNIALKAAFQPIGQGFSSALQGLFSGSLPFARGGVLQAGTPVPFAAGGIVASPTLFPLSGGGTGLMGEAGPEAIMPLTRGPDGRLGVRSNSSGVNVTFNVSTPDVQGFSQTQTQLAALLSRTLDQGQRNL